MKSKTKQARVSGTLDPIVRLPKWAQRRIAELEERVKRAEATIPWTSPGMEWFTLFWPGPDPRYRAPESLFTCDKGGTHMVCTLGPTDWVFIGRGKKPNPTADRRAQRQRPKRGNTMDEPEAPAVALNALFGSWMPIETAPKDGRHILLYRPEIQFVGYYGGANSGWRINAPGLPAVWPLPTHWMPKPPPPNPSHQPHRTLCGVGLDGIVGTPNQKGEI